LRATVPEVSPGATGLHHRHPDSEWRDFLGDRLDEALDAPLAGVVEGVAGEGDLAAVRRDLDDPAEPLRAKVGVAPRG